ncbi:basic proline-rich protein-like [Cervus elaphus]|uniref:basic proline-rich protein-like n=1 Tax=Cervus elaphus TaxID=9860 RepID=UPI001CC2AD41|nr:basic proline-rich protein-like [Cervus elaphus]XP_043734975.1 basic proline-rich protein-like [Cervus elaphus]XP_043734976.1 basic proline-rich protein-like [Cervus elaphus]
MDCNVILFPSSRVIPPPLPFRLRYTKAVFCRPSQRPEPQPTAEPEQPAAPRASPPTRPQARPHLPATVPLQPRAIPHTPCPALAFTSAGLPPAPQTHPCHPPTPTADLSQPHTGAWHGVATASMLLQRPCSSGRPIFRPGPRESHASPFPPALHADATPKHPWACLPAPCSLPPPLPAMALPRSLILVGHPPAMAPGSFVPHSHPRTLTPTAPAGASRKPPAAMASTRQATGSPFAQGTQLCPVAPERAALAAGWCPSSAVHSPTPPPKGHSPSTVVKPFGVTDGLKIGLRGDFTSGARESQPARDLALNGPAAQRGGWHAGHGEAGVSVATGPTPRGRSPSLVFGCGHRRGRCRPALATTTAHAPTPTPTRPVRPHLLPTTTDSRRTSTSPGAWRPPPGAAAAAPQEGGGGGWGWEASGGSWWKRREVATAAKRFAPGHGGAGLNRAWAGGAGSRGLCGSAEQAASGPPARPPARPRHRGAHTRPWQGKSSRPPALSVRLPWRAVLLSAASKHCARHRLLAHTPKAARQLPGSLLPALSAPNAPAGRAAELSKSRRRIPAPTPRQREALRRRRRHQQPTSNPIRASSTQRPGSTGPTAPGRRSRGLAAPRPFAPRRGPRTPPPSPPGGNAGHAASSSQLAKALLHRALGEATSHDDRGTREPAACRRHGALPRRGGVASLGAH